MVLALVVVSLFVFFLLGRIESFFYCFLKEFSTLGKCNRVSRSWQRKVDIPVIHIIIVAKKKTVDLNTSSTSNKMP
jgi:hypothetical protein